MLFFLNQGQVERSKVQTPPAGPPQASGTREPGSRGWHRAQGRLHSSPHVLPLQAPLRSQMSNIWHPELPGKLSYFTLCPNPAASQPHSPSLHPPRGPSACRGPDLQGVPAPRGCPLPTKGSRVRAGGSRAAGAETARVRKAPPTQEAGPRAQSTRLWSVPESLRLCERSDARSCSATVCLGGPAGHPDPGLRSSSRCPQLQPLSGEPRRCSTTTAQYLKV